MKLGRFVSKSSFHLQKNVIGLLTLIDSRLYMKLYNKLLRRHGFKLNGSPRFIAKSARFDDFNRITLGERLVVSMNVHFLTHDYSYTTALIAAGKKPATDIGILRDITIGDNVFIGMNSIILPGTNIGNNVIVGAGSVVRGKIPDFSVVAGNPAIVISNILDFEKKATDRKDNDLIIDKK
ncbi:MAG TPA: acyltransferase [Bacteroidales bacterium]|nr:acyltransferase [Bacteroidales bacterium]